MCSQNDDEKKTLRTFSSQNKEKMVRTRDNGSMFDRLDTNMSVRAASLCLSPIESEQDMFRYFSSFSFSRVRLYFWPTIDLFLSSSYFCPVVVSFFSSFSLLSSRLLTTDRFFPLQPDRLTLAHARNKRDEKRQEEKKNECEIVLNGMRIWPSDVLGRSPNKQTNQRTNERPRAKIDWWWTKKPLKVKWKQNKSKRKKRDRHFELRSNVP